MARFVGGPSRRNKGGDLFLDGFCNLVAVKVRKIEVVEKKGSKSVGGYVRLSGVPGEGFLDAVVIESKVEANRDERVWRYLRRTGALLRQLLRHGEIAEVVRV